VRAIAWETLIPPDGNFIMNCTSVKSKLSSVPACQSVAEKAIVERLSELYGVNRFAKDGAKYDIRLRILKDNVTVSVDTSGAGLHKRGYRTANVDAPIKETLAAALVSLSFWRPGRLLADPFCGSGTIPIEAALIGRNIAPGLHRTFAAEEWGYVPAEVWKRERAEAYRRIDHEADVRIIASDRSAQAIRASQENAGNAGVEECIQFERRSFSEAARVLGGERSGVMVTNPPYGERLGELSEAEALYREIGAFFLTEPSWSLFLITTHKGFEGLAFGRPADRRRKLYNGRLETTLYQYHGEKPRDADT
jgi:putative N6-adenine-specific DNA methylase